MKRIEPDTQRADEYLEGIEIVLCRDPLAEAVPISEVDGVYVTYIRRDDIFEPPIAVFFLFDDQTVELIGASVVDESY